MESIVNGVVIHVSGDMPRRCNCFERKRAGAQHTFFGLLTPRPPPPPPPDTPTPTPNPNPNPQPHPHQDRISRYYIDSTKEMKGYTNAHVYRVAITLTVVLVS